MMLIHKQKLFLARNETWLAYKDESWLDVWCTLNPGMVGGLQHMCPIKNPLKEL